MMCVWYVCVMFVCGGVCVVMCVVVCVWCLCVVVCMCVFTKSKTQST